MNNNTNKESTNTQAIKYETSSINPEWIKKTVSESCADDVLRDLILFYVINTPCTKLSSSSIALTEYGWSGDIWRNEKLKNVLFEVASLKRGETFFAAKTTSEIRDLCQKANLKKGFHKDRETQRIVIYKGEYNEFIGILWHIRNSFAHGRLAMYEEKNDVTFVMEDGIKKGGKFYVRSRMILKKSTLKKWMEILKSGKLPSETEC